MFDALLFIFDLGCVLFVLWALASAAYSTRALPLRALEPLIMTLLMFGFTPPACFPRWGAVEVKYLLDIEDLEEEEPEAVRIPGKPRRPYWAGPQGRRPRRGRHDKLALAAEPSTRDKRS
ncbi:MAG TPA: hypothetical protein QF873_03335 [Patescibacteria group bacterium]|nr:hypothetical protein [Patescibacteria group bacterium]